MTSTPFESSLKDRVFEICESLYRKSEKINRDVVRTLLGGGSFSTIGPLIKEWKEERLVQLEEEDNSYEQESNIVVSEESPIEEVREKLHTTSTQASFLPNDDMDLIVRTGAEKAASLLIAQEAVTSHFFQNPNELPEDLKQKLNEMRGNFTKARSQASTAAHNPQNMINLVMQRLKQPDQEGLELIG